MELQEKIAKVESRQGRNHPVAGFRSLIRQYLPEALKLPAIQVAGTNGKGSTVIWLSLLAAKNRIGIFTSPHLIRHAERIEINGKPIPEADWESVYDTWEWLFDREGFTMFEIDLWMALDWFLRQQTDLILMEVGLGGALDATTALDYLATGITNIGRDHMQFLGNTLEDIARAKAGIFKAGVPAATSERHMFGFLEELAKEAGTCLVKAREIPLPERFPSWQQANLGLAVTLLELAGIPQKPLESAVQNFFWPGRYQILQDSPLQVLDGAHNLPGIQALIKTMPETDRIFFSVLADKEAPAMIETLRQTGKPLSLVHFDTPRLADLERLARQYDLPVIDLDQAVAETGSALYCGSLKFAAAVLKHREGSGWKQ